MCHVKTVTSFIARETSKDWKGDCDRLEQTMRSVMAMSRSFIGSIIVGHDCPSFVSKNPRITWIQATHNPPARDASRTDKLQDIGAKFVLGIKSAHDAGDRWAMYLDADDLVSRRLEQKCDLEDHDAIILSGGYRWDPKSNILRRSFCIHNSCSSTHLVRLEPRWFPYWLGGAVSGPRIADQSHSDIHSALIHAAARIQRIRSPMIAYRVGTATSMSRNQIESDSYVSMQALKQIFLRRKLSGQLVQEFSM